MENIGGLNRVSKSETEVIDNIENEVRKLNIVNRREEHKSSESTTHYGENRSGYLQKSHIEISFQKSI